MSKYDLFFDPPVMNAAGSLGFAPDPHAAVDLKRLGAFITNPISLAPRSPARGKRFLSYPGGFLIHTGYPNQGLKAILKRYVSRWERAPLPVLVHLLPQSVAEVHEIIRPLEEITGITAVELGIPPLSDTQMARDMVQAARGELPVLARLPLDRAIEMSASLAATGLKAISLGPPRGMLFDPRAGLVHGRLYGPALFPLALAAVQAISEIGIPVIAAGGIYSPAQVEIMLSAGATAVQLDTILWRGGW